MKASHTKMLVWSTLVVGAGLLATSCASTNEGLGSHTFSYFEFAKHQSALSVRRKISLLDAAREALIGSPT